MKPKALHQLQVDLATLALHVEARASTYFGGPMGLTFADACRYVTEGPGAAVLVARYGFGVVRRAVARIIAADPSVLELNDAQRAQRAADRDARVTELDRLALVAYAAGDWAAARRRVDEAELLDPQRESWDQVRLAIDEAERGSLLPVAVAA